MKPNRYRGTLIAPREKCKIELYADGVRLTSPTIGNPEGKGGGVRGKIEGWSKASRRRMREFMLSKKLPDSFCVCACTYTIPGYNLPLEKTNRLWHLYQTYARRAGVAAVWRKELQKRGQLHWHAIAGMEGDSDTVATTLKTLWHKALRAMGDIEYRHIGKVTEAIEMDFVTGSMNLMDWTGAEERSAHVEVYETQSYGWKRYLHDHASKSKQEQVAENCGRAWGVIQRKVFEDAVATNSVKLPWKTYCKIVRAYNRLCTPYIKHEGALFDKRRGYTATRGKIGSSVYFCQPDTMTRLIDWATGHTCDAS